MITPLAERITRLEANMSEVQATLLRSTQMARFIDA